ncbi:hypothetical protein FACS189487_01480 [Campylobacterota bacterium]|nr:hypothetical protein FACS189487_01480 [Campylobacterota bacterium]
MIEEFFAGFLGEVVVFLALAAMAIAYVAVVVARKPAEDDAI